MTTAHAFPTGTVTMLFTDIEGSTRLLKQLGERYGEVLADHRRILREAFAAHGGREMDTQGDAFFVVFARARGAVAAAVEAQRGLAAHRWPEGAECRVRMGLHTGEPEVGEEGYHGMGLHRGARIAAAGHGGQILLSNATRELVEDDLPAGVRLRDLGEQRLKDIERPERVYQLDVEGLPSEFPPLKTSPAVPVPRRRSRALIGAALLAVVAAAVAVAVLATGHGSGSPRSTGAISADAVGIFRPADGLQQGQIPVGGSPSAVAAGAGSLWVANLGAHTVSRVDPAKQVVIDSIPVGNGPDGVAFGGGFVWVANGLDGTVSKIDPQTNTPVDTISVGNGPAGVAVDRRYVWVANARDGTLTRIDLRTDKPLPPIAIGQSADGVAIGFGSVWVTSEVSGNVTRIDASSGSAVETIQTGSGADAVSVGDGSVWVANSLDDTVARVDPGTNSVAAVFPVGDGPDGVAVAGGTVWVSNELAGTLSKIDETTTAPVETVTTGNRPAGVVLAAGSLFVPVDVSTAGHRGGTLTVLDAGGASDVAQVDPALAYSYGESQIATMTNDGLTSLRKTGGAAGDRLVPDLAVALPTPTNGGRSYTFQLRPGIRYSTGALVRPQDFRLAIERTLELSRSGAYYAGYFGGIVGARRCLAEPAKPCDLSKGIVVDEGSNTVTFNLASPDPSFLDKLAVPAADAVPSGTPVHPHGFVPATGPYEVVSNDPKRGLRLVRNPRFREWSAAAQPSGFPDTIVERTTGKPDADVAAVLSGAADLASQLDIGKPSAGVLASLRTQHASRLEDNPWQATFFLALNTRLAPFDNLQARRALNLAVDREHLRDLTVGRGLGTVTCQILPPDFDGFTRYCPYTADPTPGGSWSAPDLARARELVRASGTAGQAVTVWMPEWIDFGPAAARYLVSVLDELGYKARFRLVADPFPHEDKLGVQVGFSGWYADFPTPAGFIDETLTCVSYNRVNSLNSNFAEFCDPAIDREILGAESLQASDLQAASRLWAEVDHNLVDQAPWVPFANGVLLDVKSARTGNYEFNPQWGTLLDQLWVR